jgi:hypothetical protein
MIDDTYRLFRSSTLRNSSLHRTSRFVLSSDTRKESPMLEKHRTKTVSSFATLDHCRILSFVPGNFATQIAGVLVIKDR